MRYKWLMLLIVIILIKRPHKSNASNDIIGMAQEIHWPPGKVLVSNGIMIRDGVAEAEMCDLRPINQTRCRPIEKSGRIDELYFEATSDVIVISGRDIQLIDPGSLALKEKRRFDGAFKDVDFEILHATKEYLYGTNDNGELQQYSLTSNASSRRRVGQNGRCFSLYNPRVFSSKGQYYAFDLQTLVNYSASESGIQCNRSWQTVRPSACLLGDTLYAGFNDGPRLNILGRVARLTSGTFETVWTCTDLTKYQSPTDRLVLDLCSDEQLIFVITGGNEAVWGHIHAINGDGVMIMPDALPAINVTSAYSYNEKIIIDGGDAGIFLYRVINE